MNYTGTITYIHEGEQHEFKDIYRVDPNVHTDDSARSYIRNDLLLVAGGGYEYIAPEHIKSLRIIRSV